MHRPSLCRLFLVLFPIILILSTPNLLFAEESIPPGPWMMRETGRFELIYPQSLSDEAAALAITLDSTLHDVEKEIGVQRPYQWPLILTDDGVVANGFVGLLPRRSLWYAAPGEDFTPTSDWWMLLARHEGRHMAQFSRVDHGATRVYHILMGEAGWAAGLFLSSPIWLLEGDAVVTETLHSQEGRGRNPEFTEIMGSWVSDGDLPSFRRSVNPSLRRHTPSPYAFGYSFWSYVRRTFGHDAMEEIFNTAGRFGLPILGLHAALKRVTGEKPRDIYTQMAQEIQDQRAESQAIIEADGGYTPAILQSSLPEQDYQTIEPVLALSDGSLIFRRTRDQEVTRLWHRNPQGEEKPLIRVPQNGRISAAILPHQNQRIRVLWDSVRFHPSIPYKNQANLITTEFSLSRPGRQKRKTLLSGKYRFPELSPDGSRFVVTELLGAGTYALTIVDAVNGQVLEQLPLNQRHPAHPSWSPDGRQITFTLAEPTGRRIAHWTPGEQNWNPLTELRFGTTQTPVFSADGSQIFFTDNLRGDQALWSVPSQVQENLSPPRLMARLPYSPHHPLAGSQGQIWISQRISSTQGFGLFTIPQSSGRPLEDVALVSANEFSSLLRPDHHESALSSLPLRSLENREEAIQEGNQQFPEQPYKPVFGGITFHSWFPNYDGRRLSFSLQAKDKINRYSSTLGVAYDPIEKSPSTFATFQFTGFRPIIGLSANYTYRSPFKMHQVQSTLSFSLPMVLQQNGIWKTTATATLQAGGVLRLDAMGVKTYQLRPILSYNIEFDANRTESRRFVGKGSGVAFSTTYIHSPSFNEDAIGIESEIRLPGIFPSAQLSFKAEAESQTGNFSPITAPARGYSWENPALSVVGRVDYEFALGYPDWGVGPVLFIQRFRLALNSDFGYVGYSNSLQTGLWFSRWSTGVALLMDFGLFDSFSGLNAGVRFNWRWADHKPTIDILLQGAAF
ncbi:MAG: hypothetical protein MI717_12045 [Spirochaetales bacterium]|nr:hypothetical protein [Spirochaetales bacterium]